MSLPAAEFLNEHQSLRRRAGFCELERSQVELSGRDRAAFLHNLCSADVKKLAPGKGCEAFLTSVQGKILAWVYVFCGEETLLLETVAGQAKRLMEHLDRYIIREQVSLRDLSEDRAEVLLAGEEAPALLERLCGPEPNGQEPNALLSHREVQLADVRAAVRSVDWVSPPAFFVGCAREDISQLTAALSDAGAGCCGREAVETARVEQGTPHYGRDITEVNLPQELRRDERAISFTKGCYLGQETVARIDALGHVNRHLAGVRFFGDQIPPAETDLLAGGKGAGRVTSAVFSPLVDAPLALAYVRREQSRAGTRLESIHGEAEVVELPVEP